MNTYRLLRNNKENGPFSLEELIAKGLKPYDLVWVENRSAAWRYPSEIEELKAHAPATEEQPYDRFYKKSKTSSSTEAMKKEKPRFRITAVSRKIDTNAEKKTEPVRNVQPEHSAYVPAEMKVSTSLATFNQYNNSDRSEEAVLETKYQTSLDDIKKRYEQTVLRPKKQSFIYRYAWLLLIPILAGGIWLGYSISANAETKDLHTVKKPVLATIPADSFKQPEETSQPIAETKTNDPEFSESILHQAPERTNVETKKSVVKQTNTTQPQTVKQAITPRVSQSSVTKDDVNRTIDPKKDEIILPAPQTSVSYPSTEGRQARTREDKPAATSNTSTDKPSQPVIASAKPVSSKSKTINDYVNVEGDYKKTNNSIQDLALKVENVTPYPLDLVVLDIQYFDKNGKLQKGETVYAKNIAPRRDVIVSAPAGNNAYSVAYKVSLISAEKAGLYVVAE